MSRSASGERRPRLLVAEDDEEMRALLREVFTRDGYEVADVEDGLELRDYLEACAPWGKLPSPDVVVSDIRMPGATALEVLAQLKVTQAKVILITAFGDRKTHFEGQVLGARLVLDKPIDLDILREAVRQVLLG